MFKSFYKKIYNFNLKKYINKLKKYIFKLSLILTVKQCETIF